MAKELIAPTTAQDITRTPFTVGKGINAVDTDNTFSGEVTVFATGLAGAEAIDILISHDGGSNFEDLYEDGSQTQLTPTNTGITIQGPGVFAVDKPVTASNVGVYLSTPERP